jgi:hypothetical protein
MAFLNDRPAARRERVDKLNLNPVWSEPKTRNEDGSGQLLGEK